MIQKLLYILTFCFCLGHATVLGAEKRTNIIPTDGIETPADNTTAEEETPAAEEAAAEEQQRDRIIEQAFKHIGARYRHGTAGPRTFDCSGFTSYVFGKENISLSRCSRTQYTQGEAIRGISNLRRGDLVFFGGRRAARSVGHVGIVVDVAEDGQSFTFVHASCSGVKVDKSTSAYYSRRFIGARRVI